MKHLLLCILLLFAGRGMINAQINWFADPVTVGFSYIDGLGLEQESSSWQPGAFRMWVDDNYDTGATLDPNDLVYNEYTGTPGSRILSARSFVSPNKFRIDDINGLRVLIDKLGYSLVNSASWTTLQAYNRGASGQLDLKNGHGDNFLARLGATSENSDMGALELYNTIGDRKVLLQANDNDFTGVFEGGKGVRIKSTANITPDLVLQGNGQANDDGILTSDPNLNQSNLIFKANGGILLTLDNNGNASGLNLFQVSDGNDILLNMSSNGGTVIQKTSSGVSKPHLSIRDISSDGYARLNFRNISSEAWQIAGRASGQPAGTPEFLLFHFTEIGDILQLKGDGDAWLRGTLTQNSDIRLKNNINRLENSLEDISQLYGYNYNWKDPNQSQSLQTGVIAQEVQAVFPELVTENKDGDLSVNYMGLIPHLIESIKELKAEIEELKSQ